jgi:hypothetical protein
MNLILFGASGMEASLTQRPARPRTPRSIPGSQEASCLAAELDAIAQRGAALAQGEYIDHADLLYDENGLPK